MLRLGWESRATDKTETESLRARVISALGEFDDPGVISEAMRRFQALRVKSEPLPLGLRGVILETGGRQADAEIYDELHALAKAATPDEEKRDFYWAMASAQHPALVDKTIIITKTNEADNDRFARVLVGAAQRSAAGPGCHDIEQSRQ